MKCIVGLGNPGIRYQKTRHNIGRRLVESLAETLGLTWERDKKIQGMTARGMWDAHEVLLCYPETFMNVSGATIKHLLGWYPVVPALDLLVVSDDIALPFGHLRIRPQGSSGGHNGLKSIEAALGSENYPRLRLGIAPLGGEAISEYPAQGDLAEFVLHDFSQDEWKTMPEFLGRAKDACRLWLEGPIEQAMNAVNRRLTKD